MRRIRFQNGKKMGSVEEGSSIKNQKDNKSLDSKRDALISRFKPRTFVLGILIKSDRDAGVCN
ncbi:hypothetical protein DLM75_12770 [Leptospira stimsonii]|uniref:Uncharacterized protein n=1 Tax=Leptospira stimsonii TaxID=2202203 RepID=A0A396Z6U2_9LEPT|nr:hypothetical protein DLM75_12770 [Leptospira stimsonii]